MECNLSKFYDVLHNDAIIRVAGQIIPTAERVVYALHPGTRIGLVEPGCLVNIHTPEEAIEDYNILN